MKWQQELSQISLLAGDGRAPSGDCEHDRDSGGGCTRSRRGGGGAEVGLVCSDDATDQPGNLRHEALYGHRASRAPEPPVELLLLLLLYERSLNRSPEVNTDPTHSVLCVKRVSTQGCSTHMNKAGYAVDSLPLFISGKAMTCAQCAIFTFSSRLK